MLNDMLELVANLSNRDKDSLKSIKRQAMMSGKKIYAGNNMSSMNKLNDSKQHMILNSFMIKNFVRGIMLKHVYLFIPDNNVSTGSTVMNGINRNGILKLNFNKDKTSFIFETILKRANSTVLQFKKVCCIIIKFLECCKNEANYMKFLKYDLHKLIVAAFVLSVPNVDNHEGNKITNRESCYKLYSKISGLSVEEITNCCSIVRPILIRRSRKQNNSSRSTFDRRSSEDENSIQGNNNHNEITTNNDMEQYTTLGSFNEIGSSLRNYNRFLSIAQRSIDVHSANYNIGTTLPPINDDDSSQSYSPYSHSSESPSLHTTLLNDTRYSVSSLQELNHMNENGNNGNSNGINRRIHGNHNVRDNSPLGNGYILNAEIEQFNKMGKKLVMESFSIV